MTPAAPRGILAEGSAAASSHAVREPPAYPAPAGTSAKDRGGLRAAIGGGLVVTLVAVGGLTLALRGPAPEVIGPGRASGPRDVTAPPPSGSAVTPAPAVSGPPPASRTIRLPGSSITIHESDDDPIRLSSYSLDGDAHLYVREPGTSRFTKDDRYFQYTVNPSGSHALGTERTYDRSGHAVVAVVDRRSGTVSRIRVAEDPVYPTLPQWSPDGGKGLVTLYEIVGKARRESRAYGYAVIDVATKRPGSSA
ncbi:hypothetical protein ACFQX6_24640 [Streptosporangium lutulentum]